MALWVCRRCQTRFAVGLDCCPQCTGTDVQEDGEDNDDMPKITRHGGPSMRAIGDRVIDVHSAEPSISSGAGVSPGPPAGTSPAPEHPSEADSSDSEGGEQPSPGNSSEPSPSKPPTPAEQKKPARPKRARGAANPSPTDPAASSAAPSMGTSGPATVEAD